MNEDITQMLLEHNFQLNAVLGCWVVLAANREYKIALDITDNATIVKKKNIESQGYKYIEVKKYNACILNDIFMEYNIVSNIADEYRGKTNTQIAEELKIKSFPFAVMMENVNYNLNIGNIIRSANAFGARDIFFYGRKKIDRRGCVGTYLYSEVTHLPNIENILKVKSKYKLVAVDNSKSDKPCYSLDKYKHTPMACYIIGQEQKGISKEVFDLCEEQVFIPQFGSVRSINLAVAGGIIMNDFVTKYNSASNAAACHSPAERVTIIGEG